MRRHAYTYWGLGHMSHPEDPVSCCGRPEQAEIHRCANLILGSGYCHLRFGHDGDCEAAA